MSSSESPSPSPRPPSLLRRIATEIGIQSIWSSGWDTKVLCLQRFVRLFAYGTSTIILALFLASIGSSDGHIGLFMTLTLLGDVVISFLLTLVADGLGRRRTLAMGALLMSASGVVFALSDNYWVLVVASIFGVISPSGNEIGPFRAVEESTLAQLTPSSLRSDIFAWYTLLGAAGAACGTITCGWLVRYLMAPGRMDELDAYRVIFLIYAGLGLVKFLLTLFLSKACEPSPPSEEYHPVPSEPSPNDSRGADETTPLLPSEEEEEGEEEEGEGSGSSHGNESSTTITANKTSPPSTKPPPSPSSSSPPPKPPAKRPFPLSLLPPLTSTTLTTLLPLCLLFALDSFSSGLTPPTWLSYYFHTVHALPTSTLGTLFSVTSVLAALSTLAALPICRRIGAVKTMVFTHLPSGIFLTLIPLPPPPHLTWLALALLIARSALASMDQAPRQTFLSGIVLPAERTAVMGVVNIVKTLAQSGGPVVTGRIIGRGTRSGGGVGGAGNGGWVWVFVAAGGGKVVYDLGVLSLFLGKRGRGREEGERL